MKNANSPPSFFQLRMAVNQNFIFLVSKQEITSHKLAQCERLTEEDHYYLRRLLDLKQLSAPLPTIEKAFNAAYTGNVTQLQSALPSYPLQWWLTLCDDSGRSLLDFSHDKPEIIGILTPALSSNPTPALSKTPYQKQGFPCSSRASSWKMETSDSLHKRYCADPEVSHAERHKKRRESSEQPSIP